MLPDKHCNTRIPFSVTKPCVDCYCNNSCSTVCCVTLGPIGDPGMCSRTKKAEGAQRIRNYDIKSNTQIQNNRDAKNVVGVWTIKNTLNQKKYLDPIGSLYGPLLGPITTPFALALLGYTVTNWPHTIQCFGLDDIMSLGMRSSAFLRVKLLNLCSHITKC